MGEASQPNFKGREPNLAFNDRKERHQSMSYFDSSNIVYSNRHVNEF